MPHIVEKTIKFYSTLIFLVLMLAPSNSALGAVEPKWEYDVAASGKQQTEAMTVDSQGNTILTGFSESSSTDFFTAKVRADGSGLAWPAASFDLAGGLDVAKAVAVDGNDDIVVTGYAHNGSNYDIQTIKYRGADGSVIWKHTFDSQAHGDDRATAIAVDSLDNVYVGGYGQGSSGKYDFIILKYAPSGPNPDGTPTWDFTYNGPADGNDLITALAAGIDGLAVTGKSQNVTPDYDCLTFKLGFDKVFTWPQPQRYADTGDGEGRAVAMDAEGNVVMTGVAFGYVSPGSNQDLFTIKYAGGDGTPVWVNAVDGGYDDAGRALHVDESGDVYIVGTTFSLTSSTDILTLKYNSAGVEQWREPYNTANGNYDVGVTIVSVAEGDLFIGGYSNDDASGHDRILLLKYRKDNGTFLWDRLFAGNGGDNRTTGLGVSPNGDILVGGWSDRWTAGASDYDYYVISYDSGALNPPTDLTAETVTDTEIALSWTDNSLNEENFVLERKICTEFAYNSVTVLPPGIGVGTMSYNSAGLTPDTRYCYRIKATNTTEGSSHYSNEADAKTTVVSYATPAWLYRFNGADNGDDYPEAIASGPDNNPVVTGSTFKVNGAFDYHTVKISRSNQDPMWSADYGSPDHEPDFATSVAIDSANRVVVTGYASLYGGGAGNTNDLYTLSYPAAGPTGVDGFGNDIALWNDQYDGPGGGDDRSIAVAVVTDGSDNSVVIGYGKNAKATPDDDIYVLKYGPDGTRLWGAAPFDGGGNDYPEAVAFAAGNIFVVGKTHNGADYDFFVAKYDGGSGALVWQGAPHDLAVNGDDYVRDVAVDSAGNIYVTGYAVNVSGDGDFYTVKYASSGAISWQRPFDTGGVYDQAAAIEVDPINDDVLVAGTSFIGAGNHDFRLIRYDAAGNIVWNKTLDQPGSDDALVAMGMDGSGVVTLTGSSNVSDDDMLAVKFDEAGTVVGASIFSGSAGGDDSPVGVTVNALGEAYVAGLTINEANNADFVVFKVDGDVMPAPHPFNASPLYTSVSLYWTDNSSDEDGFRLERKVGVCSSGGVWGAVAITDPNVTSYNDTELNIGSTYCYRVQGFDSSTGESSRWVEAEVTTTQPPAPSLSGTVLSTTSLRLDWPNGISGEDGFVLERCEGVGCSFPDPDEPTYVAYNLPANTSSYSDEGLCYGQTFSYRVKAYRTDVWVTEYSNIVADQTTPTPAAPGNVSATRISEVETRVSWQDNTSDETRFEIQRCEGTSCTVIIEGANITTFNDTGLTPGTNYSYKVRAYKAAGCEWWTAYAGPVNVTTTLLAPSNPNTTVNDTTRMTLVWTDNTSSETGFRVERCTGSGTACDEEVEFDYKPALLGANSTSFVDDSACIGTTYTFRVRAERSGNPDWNTAWAADAATTATPGPPAGLSATRISEVRIRLDWSDSSSDETGFGIFRCEGDSCVDFALLTTTGAGVTTYDDLGLTPGSVYSYEVRAVKTSGCGWPTGFSNVTTASTTIIQPGGQSATVVDTTRIDLSWADNTASESRFRIERCEGSGTSCDEDAEFAFLANAEPDTTNHTDSGLCYGTTYTYRVRAEDGGDPGWQSTWSVFAARATSAPGSLTSFTVSPISESEVAVSWADTVNDEEEFILERCAGNGAACTQDADFTTELKRVPAVSAGRLLHYRMDEVSWSSGGSVADISGNGNHGTVNGDAHIIAEGKYGRAGDFDGNGDYIGTPLNIDQSGASAVTFEAWVYPTEASSNTDRFVVSTDNGGNDWGFFRRYANWYVSTGSSLYDSGINAEANQWQHIAVVFEPGVGIQLYKDGVLRKTWPASYIAYDSSDSNVTIGRRGSYGGYEFLGRIDEVIAFDLALSADEISSHYASKVADFSFADAGLSPTTPYTYRLQATKDGSIICPWTVETTATITTPAPLPPTNLVVTPIDTTRIDLSWTDNSGSETGYEIERCEDAGCSVYTPLPPVGANETGFSDTVLCAGTTYGYRVRAARSGTPIWQTDWISGSGATPAAKVPGVFTAAAMSESEVQLSWNDINADETEYVLERCDGDAAACDDDADFTVSLNTWPGGALGNMAFTDTGLAPSSTHAYRIRASKVAHCGWTTEAVKTVTTPAPPAPSGLSATVRNTSRIDLAWTDNTDTETGFRLQRCDDPGSNCGEVDFVDLTMLTPDTTTYSDLTVCQDSAYTYRLRAEKTTAPTWETAWAIATGQIAAVAAPTNFKVAITSEADTAFSWEGATFDETNFVAERCAGDATVCSQPAASFALVDTVSGEASGQPLLHYRMNETAWSGFSGEVRDVSGNGRHGLALNGANTVTAGKYDRGGSFDGIDDGISTPLNLDQSASSPGVTMEAWVYPTADDLDIARYVFGTGGSAWGLYYKKTEVTGWGTYTYRYWYITTGSQEYSTSITYTLNQWQHVAVVFEPGTGIKFYLDGVLKATVPAASMDYTTIDTNVSIGGPSFAGKLDEAIVFGYPLSEAEIQNHAAQGVRLFNATDSGLFPLTTYTYRVKARKTIASPGCSWESPPALATVTMPLPSPPADLTVVRTLTTRVDLAWSDTAASETAYRIERCQGAACADWSVPANTTFFSDADVCENRTYTYRVRAEGVGDGPWQSAYSVPVEATTLAAQAPLLGVGSSRSESEALLAWEDPNPDADHRVVLERCEGDEAVCSDDSAIFTPALSVPGSTPGTLLHYRFDENAWDGSAGEVSDVSGNGNHGTVLGGATTTTGKYDFAGSFDGVDDYIETPLNIDQSATSSGATFEAWVYPTGDSVGVPNYVFSTGSNDWGLYSKKTESCGWVCATYYYWYITTGTQEYSTSVPFTLNQWQHVAVVFEPGTGIEFYLDGVLTKTIPATVMGFTTTDSNLVVGGPSFAGKLDEVIVYDRPITSDEVRDHFQAQVDRHFERIDGGLDPLHSYTYRVKAISNASCGWEATYNTATIATPAPSAPGDFTLEGVDTNQVELSWTDATGSETAFRLERCAGADCNSSEVSTFLLDPDTTGYVDASGCNGEPYSYRLRAEKAGDTTDPPLWPTAWTGSLSATKPELVSPSGLTAVAVSATKVNLDWTDNSTDESGFRIERRCAVTGCGDFEEIGVVGANVTHYENTDAVSGMKYIYRIRAYKTVGCLFEKGFSGEALALTHAGLGYGLTVTPLNSRMLQLSWNDGFAGEEGYEIEMQIWNGEWVRIAVADADATSHVDSWNLDPGKSYNYRVRAFLGEIMAPYSDPASGTTKPYEIGDGTCPP